MSNFKCARLINAKKLAIYVNPFFVQSIIPIDENHSEVRVKGSRKQIVFGTPDEIYNAIVYVMNGGTYDDLNA